VEMNYRPSAQGAPACPFSVPLIGYALAIQASSAALLKHTALLPFPCNYKPLHGAGKRAENYSPLALNLNRVHLTFTMPRWRGIEGDTINEDG